MPPVQPTGSPSPGSSPELNPAVRPPSGETSNSTPAFNPWQFSIELSRLLVGEAGNPWRGGVLTEFRPTPEFGFGFHLDTNFTDEILATGRVSLGLPFADIFEVRGAIELGLRGLMGQEAPSEENAESTSAFSGALFALGGEVSGHIRLGDLFGLEIFTRLLYSPPGNLTATVRPADGSPSYPAAIQLEGMEWTAGLRLTISLGGEEPTAEPVEEEPDPPEPEPTESESLRETRNALTELRNSLARITEQGQSLEQAAVGPTEEAPNPETPSPTEATEEEEGVEPNSSQERIQSISQDLEALWDSAETLEREITQTTHDYETLNRGSELAQHLYILRDRTHDQLIPNPPQLDVAALNQFTEDLIHALGELPSHDEAEGEGPDELQSYRAFQEFLMQRQETVAESFFNNLRYLLRDLTEYQGQLPREPQANGLSQPDLDPAILRITQAMARLQEIRQEENLTDWRPSESTVNQWRTALRRMRTQLNELRPDLDPELYQEIHGQYQRLRRNFHRLVQSQEMERQVREIHHHIFTELYPRYRAVLQPVRGMNGAARARQAADVLAQIRQALENAPPIFRDRRARVLENLRLALTSSLTNAHRRPPVPWRRVQAEADQLIQWIEQGESTGE